MHQRENNKVEISRTRHGLARLAIVLRPAILGVVIRDEGREEGWHQKQPFRLRRAHGRGS